MSPGSRVSIFSLLLIACSPFSQNIYAQTDESETYREQLAKVQDDDQRRLEILKEWIQHVKGSDRHLAKNLLRKAISLAEELQQTETLAQLWFISGGIYNQDSSRLAYQQALMLTRQSGDLEKQGLILKYYGRSWDKITGKDSALWYFQQALAIVKDIQDPKEEFSVLNDLGLVYMYNARHEEAETYFLQALDLQDKLDNPRYIAGIYHNLGNNASGANEMDESIAYFHQAIDILKGMDDREGEALMLSLIAFNYMKRNYVAQSLEHYLKAIEIAEEIEATGIKIQCLKGIGQAHESMGNYLDAMPYYQEVMEIQEANGNAAKPGILEDIGNNYRLRGINDTAIIYFRRVIQTRDKRPANSLMYLGLCHESMGQSDSAIQYLQAGLESAQTYKEFDIQAGCLIGLGRIVHQQGNQQEATQLLEEALTIANKSGSREFEMQAAKELYQVYKEKQDLSKALSYHEIFSRLQDSLYNVKSTERLVQLQLDAEYKEEKQRIALEQEKAKAFRRNLIIALGLAIVLIFIIAWYYREKKRSNETLTKLNEEILEQKEQLEELDELKSFFFTNISHEFRTPLTIISGMADQIDQNPGKWMNKGMDMIKRNSLNLLNLVNQILDLRKLESGQHKLHLVQTDIIAYLHYLTDSFHSMTESQSIQLSFNTRESEVWMDIDKEKIQRILTNLLSNAIKFTEENGEISVSVEQSDKESPSLRIQVKDTGIGIPAAQLDHIFDRFYQVDGTATRKGEGTGIGLSLTKELVLLMGGSIHVDSEVGKGSTFTIDIPITKQAAKESDSLQSNLPSIIAPSLAPDQEASSSPDQFPFTAKQQPSLLIIEDNYDVVEYIRSCLEDQYTLSIARDGQEGIDMALEQIPDLILCDVMMPRKDGFEVCHVLKSDERSSHIPIVMLTAKVDIDSRLQGLRKGADAYLAKPFHKEELMIRLANLLEIRRKLQARYSQGTVSELEPSPEFEQEDQFILKIRQAVEEHLSDTDFNVPELCKEVGMSRSTLHRKVTALTGDSTTLFIRKIRVQKAYRMLEETDLNLSEISYAVGFGDPRYFNRSFVKIYGYPPREVRKKG